MSFYRTYRPQDFSQVLGQEDVTSTLRAQLASGKFSQAYLFTGPRGTGKTSTARIVAKVLNCDQPKDGEPDNKCPSCLSITGGSNLDVLEIDAASNRGIDEIRDLREKIKLSPTQGKYKVYIVDEVHMLTTEAFNALLKTLEEPPAHAVFILCTTEVHKIPATILSRCQKFEFGRADQVQVEKLLKSVAKKEKLVVDQRALEAIASSSEGSFRDPLTVLEQVASGPITSEKVEKMTRHSNRAEKLLTLLESENSLESVKLVNEAHQSGINLIHLTSDLITLMRDELLRAVEGGNDVRQLKLVRLIKLFSLAYLDLKQAVLPTLPLELAIVEGVGTKERIVAEVVQEVTKEGALEVTAGEAVTAEPVESPGLDDLKAKWDQLLRSVKPLNHSLEAFLRGCEPYEVTEKSVTLKFFYKFHKDMVDQPKNKGLVEAELQKLTGKELRVKTILGEKSQAKRVVRAEEVKNVEVVSDEDLVQKAVDIFNSGVS